MARNWGLGLVGAVGIVLGGLQLHLQVLALGDIDPAGNHPGLAVTQAAVRQHPVRQGPLPASGQADLQVFDLHPAAGQHLAPGALPGQCLALAQGLADDRRLADLQGLQVTVVAGQQAAVLVADVDRVRRTVDHHAHERQLVGQFTFGLLAHAHQPAQVADPGQRQQQRQGDGGKTLQHLQPIALPETVGNDHLAAPTAGQRVHFLR